MDEQAESKPEIKVVEKLAKHVDDLLTPDDNIVLRCAECHTFLMPREINQLKARVRDTKGVGTWVVVELCPACHPDFYRYRHDSVPPQSTFITLTRHEYEVTRSYEKAGLLSPIKNDALKSDIVIVN